MASSIAPLGDAIKSIDRLMQFFDKMADVSCRLSHNRMSINVLFSDSSHREGRVDTVRQRLPGTRTAPRLATHPYSVVYLGTETADGAGQHSGADVHNNP
jgi:hypothetical protein